MIGSDPAKPLKDFEPKHDYLVAIDSDGCAFDTMGIKQRECFCPWMIGYFGLQPVAKAARECKDFADLFSKTRGANRHKTTVRILTELLPSHPAVKEYGFEVPQFEHYCAWVNNPDSLLSNDGLEQALSEASGEAKAQLELALCWSRKVNESIAEIVKGIPPFPYVRESLEKTIGKADVIVCSATPNEALRREWAEHDIDKYVAIIAGQEMGKKKEHLSFAAKDKYPSDRAIMIGDAPGDMNAPKANGILFYPINPGDEVRSWKRFAEEVFDKFINGEYAGQYEEEMIAEFETYLPSTPPWLE